jgi:hypothetical protein
MRNSQADMESGARSVMSEMAQDSIDTVKAFLVPEVNQKSAEAANVLSCHRFSCHG